MVARAGERQVAQSIEDHEVEPAQLGGHGVGLADAGLLLEPRMTRSTVLEPLPQAPQQTRPAVIALARSVLSVPVQPMSTILRRAWG